MCYTHKMKSFKCLSFVKTLSLVFTCFTIEVGLTFFQGPNSSSHTAPHRLPLSFLPILSMLGEMSGRHGWGSSFIVSAQSRSG